MRWPFVWRAEYDALEGLRHAESIAHAEHIANSRADTERYTAANLALNARALAAEGRLVTSDAQVAHAMASIAQLRDKVVILECIAESSARQAKESVAASAIALAASVADRDRVDARYNALLAQFTTLRVAGGVTPDSPIEHPQRNPDPVTQAMIARARGSRLLLTQFSEFVAEQRALKVDEVDIATMILDGIADNEGVPA